MAAIIEETSTITAKGQTTGPKALRQALGVDCGGKIAYRIEKGRVTVHNPEAEHHDPTTAAFLGLIEKDFAAGCNVRDRSGTGSFQRCRSGLRDIYTRIDILGAGNIFKPSEVT
jgi:bifunctional DNA-binding transcriptional regulator/antitoxin component of YhaV-PrlF toxin-antitoxin module